MWFISGKESDFKWFALLSPYLKQSREDIELEHWDVVIARQVNRGLQGHGFQPRADRVHLVQGLTETLPGNDSPGEKQASCKRCVSEDHHVPTSWALFVSRHLMVTEEKKNKISPKRFTHVMWAKGFLALREMNSPAHVSQLSLRIHGAGSWRPSLLSPSPFSAVLSRQGFYKPRAVRSTSTW